MAQNPPPVIDSAKLLAYASNDDEVEFTDRTNIFVGGEDGLERLTEMANLAICSNYADPSEFFLFYCTPEWETKGVAALSSVEEAKLKAEIGYRGISKKWDASPYSEKEVYDYLRLEYEVDPNSKWWMMICSFCGKLDDEVEEMLKTEKATICRECIERFYKHFNGEQNT